MFNVRFFYAPIRIVCLVVLAGLQGGCASLPPPPGSMSAATTVPVRAALDAYFKAADDGNPEAVKNAFWPSGRVEGVNAGKFATLTAEAFATRNFRGVPNAAAAMQRSVEWLEVSGPGAVARVKVTIAPSSTYVDYFVLFHVDGEWRIGLKAFANP